MNISVEDYRGGRIRAGRLYYPLNLQIKISIVEKIVSTNLNNFGTVWCIGFPKSCL